MKTTLLIITWALWSVSLLHGQTWTEVTLPSVAGVSGLTVANSQLYYSSSMGVYSSSDDVNWETHTNGMTVTAGFTFNTTIFNFDDVLYSGASNGVLYKSVDFGANWSLMTGAASSASSNTAVYVNGNTIITGWAADPALRVSVDGGSNWNTTDMPSVRKSIVELNGNLFIYTLAGIYKSSDNGTTVTQLAGGLPEYGGSGGEIINSNGVLICTIYFLGVYISSDEGNTWTQVSIPEGMTSTFGVTFLADGNNVYLGCAGGDVFSSSDNGSTWTDITGTGINMFMVVNSLAVYDGYLYAGGTSLYKTEITTSTGIDKRHEEIGSVYPNPVFNDLLTVENQGAYQVGIYNLNGQMVFSKGNLFNKAVLDLGRLSKGMYLLKIETENQVETKKLIIE